MGVANSAFVSDIGLGTGDGTNLSITEAVTSAHTSSLGQTNTDGVAESFSTAKGNTQSQGGSQGKMKGNTASQGVNQTLRPILEERHTTLYSLEELNHIFTDGILTLKKRTAFATISGVGMVKIEALNTPDINVSPTKKQRVMAGIKKKSRIHKTAAAARKEIEERFARFMDKQGPPMIDHDPMSGELIQEPTAKQPVRNIDPMNPDG